LSEGDSLEAVASHRFGLGTSYLLKRSQATALQKATLGDCVEAERRVALFQYSRPVDVSDLFG